MAVKKKKKKWVKFRHRVVRNLVFPFLYLTMKLKYRIKIQKFKEQGKRQYIVLMNHQTAFDQFFVGAIFKGAVYYVASEDLFSNGFVSSLIRYLVAPIPIKKQTTDVSAVMNCMRVANEGGTIAIFPEGNRTFSGKTEYINPAIAALIKKLKLPIAFLKVEGGYGVQPRWSDVTRKGEMTAYVSKVIEPENYENFSKEEFYELIKKELYVNEANADKCFYHKNNAEYLERAMYVCPHCGLSTFISHGDVIECKKCKRKIRYLPTKELQGIDFEFPFRFVNDWYEYQCDFINRLNLSEFLNNPIYIDEVKVSEVIVYKNKKVLDKKASLSLYGDRFVFSGCKIGQKTFTFDNLTAVTVLGKNKVNIYFEDKIYQIKGDKRFNALRYVNIFYRYKNNQKGENDGKFLGL